MLQSFIMTHINVVYIIPFCGITDIFLGMESNVRNVRVL